MTRAEDEVAVTVDDGPVVVLGGTGLLGRSLAAQWPVSGPGARFLVHRTVPAWLESAAEVEVRAVDLDDAEDVERSLRGGSAIVNLLRPDGSGWCLEVVHRVTRVAKTLGITRWVQVSSIDVYGGSPLLTVDEESPTAPDTDYAREHVRLERAVQDHFTDVAVLRLGAVFGPGGRNLVALAEKAAARRWRSLALRRVVYGQRRMHLVAVEVAARALLDFALVSRRGGHEVVLVTQDACPENSFAHLYAVLARAGGRRPTPLPTAPAVLLRLLLRSRGRASQAPRRRFVSRHSARLGLDVSADFVVPLRRYVEDLLVTCSDDGGLR